MKNPDAIVFIILSVILFSNRISLSLFFAGLAIKQVIYGNFGYYTTKKHLYKYGPDKVNLFHCSLCGFFGSYWAYVEYKHINSNNLNKLKLWVIN